MAPATEQEKIVARIWQEVLGLERVGLHDNFFELGGDSLIATQIHSRIRETFKIKMPVEKLFELPTLEAPAARAGARHPSLYEGGEALHHPPPGTGRDHRAPGPDR